MEGAAGKEIPERRGMGCPEKTIDVPFPKQSRIS